MKPLSHQQLDAHLIAGTVYRRKDLEHFSKAIDRDLDKLVRSGTLKKVATGIYYKPQQSRFGKRPPSSEQLIKAFLSDDQYLLFSWNDYNKLGLGLTQLYNKRIVYNNKRYCECEFDGQKYDFKRPPRGFPEKLSPEYLLVDLVNNLQYLAEDTDRVKSAIKNQFDKFNKSHVKQLAKRYGNIATKKIFDELLNQKKISP